MKPLLVCDVDGVLANFTQAILDFLSDEFYYDATVDDVDQWSIKDALSLEPDEWQCCVRFICSDGFALNLEPLPAVDELRSILAGDDPPFDVAFCTSPWWSSKTWCHDRAHWLMKHFGQRQGRRVLQASLKHYVVGEQTTIFVDDKPEAVESWCKAQELRMPNGLWEGLLWDAPYNRNLPNKGIAPPPRVSSFAEVLEHLAGLD